MKYDKKQIAKELQDTAMNRAYYGNALKTSLDIVTDYEDKAVLTRYLNGSEISTDFWKLQDIANMLYNDV